jgi:ER membrane protein complex subunit 1
VMTSPALLESTSLIFASGLDLFFTRAAPSGSFDVLSDSFNKTQLLATIAALVVGILVVRPLVQRKMLKQRWGERT